MRFFLFLLMFPFILSGLERHDVIIKENVISPNLDNFDCHSSCVIETTPGTLCVVWTGGPGKGKSNIDMKNHVGIWMSRCEQGTWSLPIQIVEASQSVCWTPVLVKNSIGELFLFYRLGTDPRHTVSLFKCSIDGGHHWSESAILPAGIVGPTHSKPVFDDNLNMICGSSSEVGSPEDKLKATACWIDILSYCDSSWHRYGPLEIPGKRFGCIEPALFWTAQGTLKMLCRDRSNKIGIEGWIWTAESLDQGKTWSSLEKTTLPNPDSGIDAISLDNGKVLVFYNASHTCRYPLTVALSNNDGLTWIPLFAIEETSGEFPSVIVDTKGFIHVTYAWTAPGKEQRQIKYVLLKPLSTWTRDGCDPDT